MSEELNSAFELMAGRGDAAGAATVVARALSAARFDPPRRLRRPRLAAVTAMVATAALVVTGVAVVRSRLPHVERVNVGAAIGDGDGLAHVMTVLAVGYDTRTGLDDPMRRADSIILVRIDGTSGAVSVLSMPRDLYVPIVGANSSERLSAASHYGPNALIETVRAVTGIAVDHYVEFDFAAFEHVVDAAGGVHIEVPERVRDQLSGLDLAAGCIHLDGATALAYVRSRHTETLDADGRWHVDPTGDIGRMMRQQQLFVVALDELTRTRNVAGIDRVVKAVAENARVDEGFSLQEAIDFARNWTNTGGPLQLLTFPFTPGTLANGAVVLYPDSAQAPDAIGAFNNPSSGQARTRPGASCS